MFDFAAISRSVSMVLTLSCFFAAGCAGIKHAQTTDPAPVALPSAPVAVIEAAPVTPTPLPKCLQRRPRHPRFSLCAPWSLFQPRETQSPRSQLPPHRPPRSCRRSRNQSRQLQLRRYPYPQGRCCQMLQRFLPRHSCPRRRWTSSCWQRDSGKPRPLASLPSLRSRTRSTTWWTNSVLTTGDRARRRSLNCAATTTCCCSRCFRCSRTAIRRWPGTSSSRAQQSGASSRIRGNLPNPI